jgi:hypothetical protein
MSIGVMKGSTRLIIYVYYETITRELNRRLMYKCRCEERLKVKDEGCTRLKD